MNKNDNDKQNFFLNQKNLPLNLAYKIFNYYGTDKDKLNILRKTTSGFAHIVEQLIKLKVDNYKQILSQNNYHTDNEIVKDYVKNLTEIFTNPNNLGRFLAIYENEIHFKEKFELIFDIFQKVCNSVKYFNNVVKFLNEMQTRELLTKFDLQNIITTQDKLIVVIENLNAKQFKEFCNLKSDTLVKYIKSVHDFEYFILPSSKPSFDETKKTEILFEAFKDNLLKMIKSGISYNIAVKYLGEKQKNEVYQKLKHEFKAILSVSFEYKQDTSLPRNNQAYYIGKFFEVLNEEQVEEVCQSLKNYLLKIIKSGSDIGNILENLNEKKKNIIFKLIRDNLISIINGKTIFFIHYYNNESEDKSLIILGDIDKNIEKDNVSNFAESFSRAIEYLDENQRTYVYKIFKNSFENNIKTGTDLGNFIQYLNTDQITYVYEKYKYKFNSMIKSSYEFNMIMKKFNENQREQVYKYCHNNFKDFKDDCHFIENILPVLNENQILESADIIDIIKKKISDLEDCSHGYYYANPFLALLKNIGCNKVELICKLLGDDVNRFIKTSNDLQYAFEFFEENQILAFYNTLKDKMVNIKEPENLNNVIKGLSEDKVKLVYKLLEDDIDLSSSVHEKKSPKMK